MGRPARIAWITARAIGLIAFGFLLFPSASAAPPPIDVKISFDDGTLDKTISAPIWDGEASGNATVLMVGRLRGPVLCLVETTYQVPIGWVPPLPTDAGVSIAPFWGNLTVPSGPHTGGWPDSPRTEPMGTFNGAVVVSTNFSKVSTFHIAALAAQVRAVGMDACVAIPPPLMSTSAAAPVGISLRLDAVLHPPDAAVKTATAVPLAPTVPFLAAAIGIILARRHPVRP